MVWTINLCRNLPRQTWTWSCGDLLSRATSLFRFKGGSHLPSDQVGIPQMIHRNKWLWETWLLNELLQYTLCAHPLTELNTPKQRSISGLKEWSREGFTEGDLADLLSCNKFHRSTMYFQRVCDQRVCVITRPCEWKLCALISPLAGKTKSFPFQMFFFHCGMLSSFTGPKNQSVCLWVVIFLSSSASVVFFKPGSGNFFSVSSRGYDNHPVSISTADLFVVRSDHLLFCIMEIFSIYLLWRALWNKTTEIKQSHLSASECEGFFLFFWEAKESPDNI